MDSGRSDEPPVDDDDEPDELSSLPALDIQTLYPGAYRDPLTHEWIVPATPPPDNGNGARVRPRSSWAPIDLTAALDRDGIPPPALLARDDGLRLLYAGRVHWLYGEPESGKSWIALVAVKEALEAGAAAAVVDYEDDETGLIERLRALSVPDDVIVGERFSYVRPEEPLVAGRARKTPAAEDYAELLAAGHAVIVIDGTTEAMVTEGLDPLDNADVAHFMRRLARPAAESGAAVVCLDHVTKSKEGRSWAIGGQHKRAGLTGAAYLAEIVKPFGRGLTGEVRLTLGKDRPGHVRAAAKEGKLIATVTLESYADGGVSVHVESPDDDRPPNAEHVAIITEHLTVYPGAPKSDVRALGNSDAIDRAVKWMVADGTLEVRREGRAHRHYLTDAPSDAELDAS